MSHERKSRFARAPIAAREGAGDADAEPIAPRVGADLRAARERLGWSLEYVTQLLRIRGQYLLALEDGRIDALPGNAYALGFLRLYAITLGLDADELTRRFRSEAAEINRKTELIFPVPVPERGVPAGAVVLLGVVLVIGAYIGWYRLSGNGELPPEAVAPVPARLAPLAEQAAPVPPPLPATAPAPAPASAPVVAAVGTPSAAPPAAAPAPAPVAASAPPDRLAVSEPAPSLSPSQAAAATTMPSLAVAAAPQAADQPRIVLSANADAWLLVHDKSGQVLLNRVLHPGETWPVPQTADLTLTTGNAGGTDILVDGVAMPPLGGPGAVRREIPLDPDLLKAGKSAGATPPVATASATAPKAAPQ